MVPQPGDKSLAIGELGGRNLLGYVPWGWVELVSRRAVKYHAISQHRRNLGPVTDRAKGWLGDRGWYIQAH